MGAVTLTFLDHDGFTSRVRLNVANGSNATFDGLVTQANPGAAGGLAAAIAAMSTCVVQKSELIGYEMKGSSTPPVDESSHRQAGILVRYSDDVTGDKYHVTIPGPNYASIKSQIGGELDLTFGPMPDLVAAFHAAVKSPDGNPVTVTGARVVGRSN